MIKPKIVLWLPVTNYFGTLLTIVFLSHWNINPLSKLAIKFQNSPACFVWNSHYIYVIIPPLIEWGLYCNHLVRLSVRPFTLSLQISQLLLEEMILYLIYGFGMVTCTMSPLSRFTAHLLPVYRATYKWTSGGNLSTT